MENNSKGIVPKVFVTQESNYDFGKAEFFGQVEFLTASDLNNIKGSLHNEDVLAQIAYALRTFDPEIDYILPVGSPYIVAAVFMMIGLLQVRTVKILRWSNRDRVYIPLHLEFRPHVMKEIRNGRL